MLEGGTMSKWHGGKGSKPRPVKDQKKFDDEWDRIFGKSKPEVKARKVTPSHGATKVHKNKKKPSRVDLKRELRDNTDYGNE